MYVYVCALSCLTPHHTGPLLYWLPLIPSSYNVTEGQTLALNFTLAAAPAASSYVRVSVACVCTPTAAALAAEATTSLLPSLGDLVFTAHNFSTAAAVSFRAERDFIATGALTVAHCNITAAVAVGVGSDPLYASAQAENVSVSITDADRAGIILSPLLTHAYVTEVGIPRIFL